MAGVLEMVNDRRAYFQQLRQNDPKTYTNTIVNASVKTERQLKVLDTNMMKREEETRYRDSVNTDIQQRAINNVSYSIGNDLGSLKKTLVSVMDEQTKILKDIRLALMFSQSKGLLPNLLDNIFGGGRGPKGPGEVKPKGKGVLGTIKNVGSKIFSAKGLGIGASIAALGYGAYDLYQNFTDEEKTDQQKAIGVTKAAGGVAGGLSGAAIGGVIGGALMSFIPRIGTAIGAAVGSALGGWAGTVFGSDTFEGIASYLTDALEGSKFSEYVGMATAAILSPFSEEARAALLSDFKNNIIPEMNNALLAVTDFVRPFSDAIIGAGTSFINGVQSAYDSLASFGESFYMTAQSYGDNIALAASGLADSVFGVLENLSFALPEAVSSTLGSVGSFAENLLAEIPTALTELVKALVMTIPGVGAASAVAQGAKSLFGLGDDKAEEQPKPTTAIPQATKSELPKPETKTVGSVTPVEPKTMKTKIQQEKDKKRQEEETKIKQAALAEPKSTQGSDSGMLDSLGNTLSSIKPKFSGQSRMTDADRTIMASAESVGSYYNEGDTSIENPVVTNETYNQQSSTETDNSVTNASARQEGFPIVNPMTPKEVREVRIINQQVPPKPEKTKPTVVQGTTKSVGGFSLDDIPIFFADLALFPILAGKE